MHAAATPYDATRRGGAWERRHDVHLVWNADGVSLADCAAMLEHLELNARDRLPNERNLPPRECACGHGTCAAVPCLSSA